MSEDKCAYSIHKGRNDYCAYCGESITEDEMQLTYVVHPTYWHLFGSGQCEGWIHRNWSFITSLLFQLAEVGGEDYIDTIRLLISIWEEGTL